MSQKRRNGEPNEATGRERKKLKISAAREIPVQSTSSSKQTQNDSAGPSRVIPTSLKGLPSSIGVEKFVEARAFEIDAMHSAMKTASASSTHRVWQTLPRHLRRRAASHDVRRVPLRLRERAAAEMDPPKEKTGPAPSKKQKGKASSQNRTENLLKRQIDKTWLETHLWHSKRMHMENMWGYRLATSPTEKSYRPSLRAVQHDAIIHDASYYSMIELQGSERLIINLLDLCCDPQNPSPGSKRYLNGSRVYQTHVYSAGEFPLGLIGPMTILWRPLSPKGTTSTPASTAGSQTSTQHSAVTSSKSTERSVWLRFHPSIHLDVMEALKTAASQTLAAYQSQNPSAQPESLDIIDLKGRQNVYEIMGPKSSQIIKGALSPVTSDKRSTFLELWRSLKSLRSPGSLPRGMVIGCTVDDPRLKFPPKNARPDKNAQGGIVLPSPSLAESDIWDDSIRTGLKKPKFKQADLDARRAKNEIPGTRLQTLRQDDRVPILLIQHSWETHEDDAKALHGWMLIVPEGWSMPFFNSLVFTGSRVAGQDERQTQAYEAGIPYFPRDYPCTNSYEGYAEERESKDKSLWDRKPPAKRPNYEALNTKSPWRADWYTVLGLQSSDATSVNFMATQREPQVPVVQMKPWLLQGTDVKNIVSNLFSVFNHGTSLVTDLNKIRLKRGLEPLSRDIKPAALFQSALVNVRLSMCSRGTPEDLAMIYPLSDERVRQWKRLLEARRSKEVLLDEVKEEDVHGVGDIIGSVTTGHFSFLRGQGFAIGAVSLASLLQLEQQHRRMQPNVKNDEDIPVFIVAVRNGNGRLYRSAYLEVV
ncbi:hypothetical protein CVT24_004815 [Panaeolus cyanescens]|uniref:Uncharacterized protein n=1 Tax=Panaeolus cyanescens TaxID=181874 RepID=A0A409VPZ6_9AGAR|nr:hypothetical protein CVT24_004815 [Panaeolus cyanescens]